MFLYAIFDMCQWILLDNFKTINCEITLFCKMRLLELNKQIGTEGSTIYKNWFDFNINYNTWRQWSSGLYQSHMEASCPLLSIFVLVSFNFFFIIIIVNILVLNFLTMSIQGAAKGRILFKFSIYIPSVVPLSLILVPLRWLGLLRYTKHCPSNFNLKLFSN